MNESPTKAGTPRSSVPLAFFLLTFSLAIPFWVLGGGIGLQFLPGLPVAALTFVCPSIAALLLVRRESGSEGAKALLKRAFDFERIKAKAWYAPILLLNPAIAVSSYAVLRLIGTPVPASNIPILATLTLCAVFFIGAVGEELGWSGYAIEPMRSRWGALRRSSRRGMCRDRPQRNCIERPHRVGGHSLGVAIALGVASRIADRIAHLVLIAGMVPAPGAPLLSSFPFGMRLISNIVLRLSPEFSQPPVVIKSKLLNGMPAALADQAASKFTKESSSLLFDRVDWTPNAGLEEIGKKGRAGLLEFPTHHARARCQWPGP